MAGPAESPHFVDQSVGLRIRLRRKEVGMSQERLAEALGLTFQQIQKYERGTNRVSASKLFEISRALGVSPAYFFAGLDEQGEHTDPGRPLDHTAFLLTPEGAELARSFPRLPARQRRKIMELVRELLDPEARSLAAE